MGLEHLPADTPPEKLKEVLERDGGCIVDELVERSVMDRLIAELQPHLDATPIGADEFGGTSTKRTGALIARSELARELVQHPLVLATARQLLHHSQAIQLHLTQVISIGPSETDQPIHRDQWAFDFFPFPKGMDIQCNTIWAMTDFTEANGATRIVPGSNQMDDRLQFERKDTVAAEMEQGSVLFYTGSVYHGGGANQTQQVRMGLNLTYVVAWLRQEENQYLSVPREIAATLDEPLLRLMGYARGAYALGYIDDLRDPIEAVRPEFSKTGFGDLGDLERAQELLKTEV
jgi:ectoine hydroxylase-related dioxygenase (phytanoyl-CoA dioxygenase family)